MTKCDNCKHKFVITIKTRKEDNIETTYFKCPACQEEYITLTTDAKLRKLIQHTQNLLKKAMKGKKQKDIDIYKVSADEVKLYAKDNNLMPIKEVEQ